MSLFLADGQDHALLAMVIEEASQTASEQGSFVGRTAVQKIMYFLKALGVPMGYRFDIHHYGPFCDEILRDAEWLIADNVIVDHSNNPQKYSNYTPDAALPELLAKYNNLEPLRKQIQSVVRTLVPMRPERLELLATLDYLYRKHRAGGGDGPWKSSVLKSFLEIKGERFQQADVEHVYDAMVKIGLVTP